MMLSISLAILLFKAIYSLTQYGDTGSTLQEDKTPAGDKKGEFDKIKTEPPSLDQMEVNGETNMLFANIETGASYDEIETSFDEMEPTLHEIEFEKVQFEQAVQNQLDLCSICTNVLNSIFRGLAGGGGSSMKSVKSSIKQV